jgi:hypothetical protein
MTAPRLDLYDLTREQLRVQLARWDGYHTTELATVSVVELGWRQSTHERSAYH